MDEYIIWSNELKQFSDNLTLKELLKDVCETWDVYEVEECEYFQYIGIGDITDRKIYAGSSIVEFEACNVEFKGVFRYSTEDLHYYIEVLSDDTGVRADTYGLVYSKKEFKNIKIIDTIQENKLGLIK